jgi:hypothetical protein
VRTERRLRVIGDYVDRIREPTTAHAEALTR